MDDDSYVRVSELLARVDRMPRTAAMLGYIEDGGTPHRDPANQWYASPEEWPSDHYPPWAHGAGLSLRLLPSPSWSDDRHLGYLPQNLVCACHPSKLLTCSSECSVTVRLLENLFIATAGYVLTADLVAEIAAGAALKPQAHRLFKLEDIAMGSWIDFIQQERGLRVCPGKHTTPRQRYRALPPHRPAVACRVCVQKP